MLAQNLRSATALAKTVDAHYNHLQSLQARYTERYRGHGDGPQREWDAAAEEAGKDAVGV